MSEIIFQQTIPSVNHLTSKQLRSSLPEAAYNSLLSHIENIDCDSYVITSDELEQR